MFFGIFKKTKNKRENKCKHKEISLGKYYYVHKTQYKNDFDTVFVYKCYFCTKCNKANSQFLGSREFNPSLYHGEDEMNKYIKELEEKNIMHEIDMKEKVLDLTYIK